MIKVKRSELVNRLDKLEKCFGENTLPITKGILISQIGNKVLFLVTKLDVFAQTFIEVGEGTLEGRGCVDARMFIDVIRKTESEEVSIDIMLKDNKIIIATDKAKAEMQMMDADQFPELPSVMQEQGTVASLELKQFLSAVKHNGFAVSTDESKPAPLRCIRFVVDQNNVSLISTDGFRLAKFSFTSDTSVAQKVEINVTPATLISILERQNAQEGSKCYMNITKTHIVLQFPDSIYIIKVVEGDYLNVEQMLKVSGKINVTVNRKELYSAIELLDTIKSSKLSILKFCLNDDKLLLMNEVDNNSINQFVKVEHEGEDIEILFNLKYMKEVLNVITSENVIFRIESPLQLVHIEPVGYDYHHAILPIRPNK